MTATHRTFLLLGSLSLLLGHSSAQQVDPATPPHVEASQRAASPNAAESAAAIGDAERSALTFTAYDLSVQLRPEDAGLSVLAQVTVRNDGRQPLPQIALQISSSLHWDGISGRQGGRTEKLSFDQHPLETDADHTGKASEAVIRLTKPLEPQASAELTLLYSGAIRVSSARSSSDGSAADWDLISADGTLLRGFGNVLWYPVASPQVFAGEGASLLQAAGGQIKRQAKAAVHARVSVEYRGEPPTAVFFCGREEPLLRTSDDADAPIAEGSGVATAEFSPETLGFRTPSIFVTGNPVPGADGLVETVSGDAGVPERVSSASVPILELVNEWLGKSPARVLTVIDHAGAPFADGRVLVAPVLGADAATLNALLVPSLTHTRFRSLHLWLDQGVPQFLSLLWMERTQGRAAALAALEEQTHALALSESGDAQEKPAKPGLLETSEAVYYRNKSAAVLWMLRTTVGDDLMKRALQRYVHDPRLDADAGGFEKLLEEISGKKLQWLFDDWVYHDRGLPELSIVSAAPRELSAKTGGGAGWLVAVEVRNDGGAAAEVPVTVSSGTLTATERLHIGAHSVASTRVLFQGVPEQVQVNDGSVPELISSTHVQAIAGR